MKAVVKFDNKPGATEIRQVQIPEISEREVLIRIKYAGICGGDPHIHNNTMSYPSEVQVPLILGHECSGIVERVGKDVKSVKIGDRVCCETHYGFCGECFYCKQGKYNHCKDRKGLGASADGVFAEFVKVPAGIVHILPESLSLRKAALTEPLCVVYNAIVKQSNFKGGDTVAIIGAGPIGLLAALLAKTLGAAEVVVIGTDRDNKRLEIAEELGCTAIDVTKVILDDVVCEYGAGIGFDLVIDAAGNTAAFQSAIVLVRKEGEISKIGFGPLPFNHSLDPLLLKAVTVHYAFSHTWDVWEKCIRLLASGMDGVEKLITHELPLEEFEKGFHLVDHLDGIKVLLIP